MKVDQGARIGSYVILKDFDGLRHAIRPAEVAGMSDGDPCRDTTLLRLTTGRLIMLADPLDQVLAWLELPRCP